MWMGGGFGFGMKIEERVKRWASKNYQLNIKPFQPNLHDVLFVIFGWLMDKGEADEEEMSGELNKNHSKRSP